MFSVLLFSILMVFFFQWFFNGLHSSHDLLARILYTLNRKYPVGLQHIFFWGGGGGEVFLTASALKSFVLKLDLAMSTFLDIFVQDYRFKPKRCSGTQCISLWMQTYMYLRSSLFSTQKLNCKGWREAMTTTTTNLRCNILQSFNV